MSKSNQTEDTSCGLDGQELSLQCRWITGPNFLWLHESEWPQRPGDLDNIPVDDPEVKKSSAYSTDVDENTNFLARLSRFSEWHRLKRYFVKPKQGITDDGTRRSGHATKAEVTHLRGEELNRAENTILKLVQNGAFSQGNRSLTEDSKSRFQGRLPIGEGEEV